MGETVDMQFSDIKKQLFQPLFFTQSRFYSASIIS